MSGSLPRVIGSSQFLPIGRNGSLPGAVYDFQALLVSYGHYQRPNGSWSGGGPFYKISESVRNSGDVHIDWLSLGDRWQGTTGGVLPVAVASAPSWATMMSAQPSYASQVSSNTPRFTKGWERTRPGNPTANLGQFLVELRDLPTIPGRSLMRSVPFSRIGLEAKHRLGFFQSLGSEYLNVVFGWKPFVKDLQDIYRLMKTIDKQIAQIRRDNGKGVRRRGSVEDSNSSVQNSGTASFPFQYVRGAPPNWTGGRSYWTDTTTTVVKSWYAACYMYHIMDTTDWKWDARARLALFGALPTPALLWEVLPWSWLVDWFVNVGDVMSNASMNAVDNLVALYSYIMTTTTLTRTASTTTSWPGKTGIFPARTEIAAGNATISSVFVRESKVRCPGTPYGIGLSYSGLSGQQKAVLAALGMSRSSF